MQQSEQKCTHFCSGWCIVGYVTSALWYLSIWSIQRHCDIPQDQSELQQKTAMDLARRFAENTSLGGMAYMNIANRWWSTAFWVVIFVSGLALCMGHLYLIFQNYYEYPYSTIGEMKFDLLPFPSVTVCNRNPIRVSGMDEVSQDLQEYLRNMAPAIQDPDNNGKGDGTTDPGQEDMPSNKEPDSGLSTAQPYEPNIGLEAPGSSNASQPLPGRTKVCHDFYWFCNGARSSPPPGGHYCG